MAVSLGCEKLQPARLLPAGGIPIQDIGSNLVVLVAQRVSDGDVVAHATSGPA